MYFCKTKKSKVFKMMEKKDIFKVFLLFPKGHLFVYSLNKVRSLLHGIFLEYLMQYVKFQISHETVQYFLYI